eukprot:1191144-Ditylum_brightwellii.AAC.1
MAKEEWKHDGKCLLKIYKTATEMVHHDQTIKFKAGDCDNLGSQIQNYLVDKIDQGDGDENCDSKPGTSPINNSENKDKIH